MSAFGVAERRRVLVVLSVLAFMLTLIVLKSARLQLSLGADLKQLAERQYIRDLKFSAPRGNVYDVEGRPLAVSVPVWSVAASPRDIENPIQLAEKLAPILEMSREKLEKRLSRDAGFIWLRRRVAPEMAEQIRALNHRALGLHRESRRFYPNKELAGAVIGLVNIDGEGQSGIERAFDDHLRGRSVAMPGLRDNHGQRALLGPGVDLDVLAGDDVFLSIDANLQHVAEEALRSTMREFDAKSAFAIVVEPSTGRILALANAPLFNPNLPSASPVGNRKNHALADTFEPGSTFKIVTFAAALETGAIHPSERVFCENGRYQIGRFTIRDTHPETWLTARDVFKHSSNIGTLKIALRVGEKPFRELITNLGFGARVDVGLAEEVRALVPAQERWGDVRLATTSYGHGLTVTGLQLASLVATVANDGVKIPLTVIDRVQSSAGDVVREPVSDEGVRVFSKKTARTLVEIMTSVTEEGGTGARAAIDGVKVAGKTGTAEKVDPVTGRYSRDLHVSSFVGFAPADAPRIAAIVVVDEPKGTHFGGSTAGPAWKTIVEAALVERGLLARDPDASAATANAQNADKQRSLSHKESARSQTAREDKSQPVSPFLGLTARDALALASEMGLDVELNGSGTVKSATLVDGRAELSLSVAGPR